MSKIRYCRAELVNGKSCGAPLPATRYFHCERCVPHLPADDEFTEMWADPEDQPEARTLILIKEKRCYECKETKPADAFGMDKRSRDNKRSSCIACDTIRCRKYEARYRQKLAAKKEARRAAAEGRAVTEATKLTAGGTNDLSKVFE